MLLMWITWNIIQHKEQQECSHTVIVIELAAITYQGILIKLMKTKVPNVEGLIELVQRGK